MNKIKKPKAIGDLLKGFEVDKNKYVSREFQDYGFRLAEAMGDTKHASLYIKLAKDYPRARLEQAKNFVADANNVRSRPKLFMWKLKQIKDEKEKMKSVKVLVYGQVQGVGFRYWAKGRFKRLGIEGTVFNNEDGTVGAEFAGGKKVMSPAW